MKAARWEPKGCSFSAFSLNHMRETHMCTHTHLTESLGLSHQYQHIGGKYGQAEVHQDDGPL